MIVDQNAHPPHHLPNRSRHGSGTACHDRQALVSAWAPLAHALAHSRSDGHQAQPEGLETIPSRSAQCWHLPREARSRLERSVEASIAHVSRAAGCHMAGSALAATARDQTSGGGAKYGKEGSIFGSSQKIGALSLVFAQSVENAKVVISTLPPLYTLRISLTRGNVRT